MYRASIRITLRPSILDPQGRAIHQALGTLGFPEVAGVRMGKYAEMLIDAPDRARAEEVAQAACERLLANPVMEDFSFTLEPAG